MIYDLSIHHILSYRMQSENINKTGLVIPVGNKRLIPTEIESSHTYMPLIYDSYKYLII